MREAEEIRRGLFNMLEQKDTLFQATVTDINEEDFTCTVLVEKRISYYNVRLRSVINPELDGAALIPRIGSYVLVGRIGKSNELFVCLFSEIDKIIFSNEHINFILDNETVKADVKDTTINITETGITVQNEKNNISFKLDSNSMELDVKENTIEISDSTITFNNGKNDGLVQVKELTEKINSFISKYNNHTHTIDKDGITGSPAATNTLSITVSKTSNTFDSLTYEDYENINIKH